MKTWSDFFFWKLLEQQKTWIKSMDDKHDGKVIKVIKSWRAKETLPIYHDLALHKVVHDIFGITVPKATISDWISHIPELLSDDEELKELLDDKNEVRISDNKKYTQEEWEYMQKMKWESLMMKQRTMLTKLNNPNLSDIELRKMTWASQRLINEINNYWITLSNETSQSKFISLTESIVEKGLKKIMDTVSDISVHKAQDLKSVTGAVSDIFQMNRLLKWESTQNIWIWIEDIRAKILAKAEQKKIKAESDQKKLKEIKSRENNVVKEIKKTS